MQINEYQEAALTTAQYPEASKINYPILGLLGEAGELANKYKKVIRDDGGILSEEKRKDLIMELSDVMWYCATLANDLNVDLNTVCELNIQKLNDRKLRGVIKGSGDNR
jgi:NTP pyrophosphatase (non-canonical NTP hydrolase)